MNDIIEIKMTDTYLNMLFAYIETTYSTFIAKYAYIYSNSSVVWECREGDWLDYIILSASWVMWFYPRSSNTIIKIKKKHMWK